MPIVVKQRGSFNNLSRFLSSDGVRNRKILRILERYGQLGVDRLYEYTPKDTGMTALSWDYAIEEVPGGYRLSWTNDNTKDGYNIALLIQYGHGLQNGGYVAGFNYINPAMQPVFERLGAELGDEVRRV